MDEKTRPTACRRSEPYTRRAQAAVLTARKQAAADAARVDQARAVLVMADAKVRVADASFEKAQVMVAYTKITSPYDGVDRRTATSIAVRFIRTPDQGGQIPLLCVDRMDLMHVVVQIPEQGSAVYAIPATRPRSGSMLCRITLLKGDHLTRRGCRRSGNTHHAGSKLICRTRPGLIRDGMYGKVDIELEPAPAGVTISSACLVGDQQHGKSQVFVVQQGKARLTAREGGQGYRRLCRSPGGA